MHAVFQMSFISKAENPASEPSCVGPPYHNKKSSIPSELLAPHVILYKLPIYSHN